MAVVHSYDEYNDFAPRLAAYREALTKLEDWGVPIPRTSRLRQYEARLAEADTVTPGPVTPAFADQLIVDLREIDELVTIASSFPTPPTPAERDLLVRLNEGAEHPDDERSSPGREAQFELVMRAFFQSRGQQVLVGHPDLTLIVDGTEYSFEAKRPGSPQRFDERLRRAANQVAAHGKPGLVAICMDEVIRPEGTFLVIDKRELLGQSIHDLIKEFIDRDKRAIAKRVAGKNVVGILFMCTLPAREATTGLSLMGVNHHIEVVAQPHDPAHSLIDKLVELFRAGPAS